MNKNKTLYLALIAVASIASVAAITISIPFALSQEYAILADKPSIKVTGDASIKVVPDQAVMIVVVQTQPGEITSALDEQKSRTDRITQEIKSTLIDDQNASITIGQMSINPVYSGTPSYSGISTFTIYSSTAVNISIDNFAEIVKKLSESGFGFEGVYATHMMYPASYSMREEAAGAPNLETDATKDTKQMTINVSINTKPGKLDDVLAEYDEKYKKLVSTLEDAGITSDQIKPANVNINPFYYGQTQSSTFQTYSQIIVRTDAKNIEKVSSVAQKEGAYVESTFLSVSDSEIEKLRDELNSQAFDNAKTRAESMAKLAGFKVSGVKKIETVNSVVNPYGGVQPYKGLYVVPPYYYQPTSGEIASSVTVEFELTK